MPQGLRFGETGREASDVDRRVLGQHTDEIYDRVWLSPVGATGTTTLTRLGGRSPAQQFPDAATTGCNWDFAVRDNWRNHHLRVTVYFASDAGSTNVFSIRTAAWAYGLTIDPQTGRAIDDVTANYAGPAAATTQMSYTLNLTASSVVTSQTDSFLTLYLRRDGVGDANNNILYVLGVLVEAYPA